MGGSGAPKVNTPLDASRFVSQPCAVITASLLQQLEISEQGKPDTDSETAKTSGPLCIWHNRDKGLALDVGLLTGNKNGLTDTYLGKAQFVYFEPTVVDGYPAVFNDLDDYRSSGTCNITVGISDALAFRAAIQDANLGTKSCDKAKQVASAVIRTVKGA
jgi:hypothetical protein